MGWENTTELTLMIERHGVEPHETFRIGAFMRRTRRDGSTFLEPFPAHWVIRQLEFAEVRFVPPPGTRRDAGAGELSLTHANSADDFGGRR